MISYWNRFNDWITLWAITIREFFLKWAEEQREKQEEWLKERNGGQD